MTQKRVLATGAALVAIMLIGAIAWSGCGAKTVATVDGTGITQEELDAQAKKDMATLPANAFPKGKEGEARKLQVKKDSLTRLIDQLVIQQQAEKLGIKVSDADVEKQIADIKKRYPSEKEFNAALAQQKWTQEDLKDNMRNSAIVQELIKKLAPKVKVSDKAALDYYKKNRTATFTSPEQFHARHILVKDLKTARKAMDGLTDENFAARAKKYSTDPGSKAKGGDLGFVSKGMFVPEFEKTALALDKKEISEPVKSQFGYHIIQLLEHKKGGVMSYKQVKDQIKSMIQNQKVQESMQTWLEKVKKASKIVIEDSSLK